MLAVSHSLAHRGSGATRPRAARWQPYASIPATATPRSSYTPYLNTPASSVSSSPPILKQIPPVCASEQSRNSPTASTSLTRHASLRDLQKSRYVNALVGELILYKGLCVTREGLLSPHFLQKLTRALIPRPNCQVPRRDMAGPGRPCRLQRYHPSQPCDQHPVVPRPRAADPAAGWRDARKHLWAECTTVVTRHAFHSPFAVPHPLDLPCGTAHPASSASRRGEHRSGARSCRCSGGRPASVLCARDPSSLQDFRRRTSDRALLPRSPAGEGSGPCASGEARARKPARARR